MIELNKKIYPKKEITKLGLDFQEDSDYFYLEENIMNFKAVNHILIKLLNENEI